MTEQEAFEHWVDTFDSGLVVTNKLIWKAACEWQRSVCNEELVMLRQRVQELEERALPQACCQDFARCQTPCLVMGDHWRAKASELDEALQDYKAELETWHEFGLAIAAVSSNFTVLQIPDETK